MASQPCQFSFQCGDSAVAHRRVVVGRARSASASASDAGVGVCRGKSDLLRSGRLGPPPSRATARRHNAARSAVPSRHRGPVSTAIAATPSAGSATSRRVETIWATSGIDSRPARPTTSTGIPRATSSWAIGPASALRRTRTAAVTLRPSGAQFDRPPTAVRPRRRCAACTAPCRVAPRPRPQRAHPRPSAAGPRPTRRWPVRVCAAGCANWSAVRRWEPGAVGTGKSVVKRGRLVAEAPRQP